MLIVKLNPKEEKNIKIGFPWVYNNEVHSFIGAIENGAIVQVNSFEDDFVAYGFLNVNSKLMIRILSLEKDEILDRHFFEKESSMP